MGGSTASVAVVAKTFASGFVSFFATWTYSSQVFGGPAMPAFLKTSVFQKSATQPAWTGR